jgi:hypothetical protein
MNESSAHEPRVPADDLPVPAGPATVPHGARPRQGPSRLVLRVPFANPMVRTLVRGRNRRGGHPRLAASSGGRQCWTSSLGLCRGRPGGVGSAYRQVHPAPRHVRSGVGTAEAGVVGLAWTAAIVVGHRNPGDADTQPTRHSGKQGPPPKTTYQLNLILENPAERRLNVMTSPSSSPTHDPTGG